MAPVRERVGELPECGRSGRSARATVSRTSPRSIPTERKVELIDALARTGLRASR